MALLGNILTLSLVSQLVVGRRGRVNGSIDAAAHSDIEDKIQTNRGWKIEGEARSQNMFVNQMYLDTKHYGIWDRSNEFDQTSLPLLRGYAAGLNWRTFEPEEGKFDFTDLEAALTKAYKANASFYTMVAIGPDSPQWIYKYVPKVWAHPDPANPAFDKSGYPYYLNGTYIELRNKMIHKFATYVRNHRYAESVGFVQANFGCTGDAELYKTEPLDNKYAISPAIARVHMKQTWEEYKQALQEGNGRVIPILINPDDDEDVGLINYAVDTFGGAMGIKGSAYVRGHHLTGERSWIELHRPQLLNATSPSKETFFFSRAEMDLTWTKRFYQLNLNLGFYWGFINGLNQGLGVHDVSAGALKAMIKSGWVDNLEFFNLYAPQVWPMNSTNAFIALHEGLDAGDLDKFPAGPKWGPKGTNIERVRKICAAYSAFGCQVNDEKAVLLGQVYQRANQLEYNDVGFDIWPTNYGRWIEQIDADVTSQGMFRIGGPITNTTSKYARFARGLVHKDNKNGMYFRFSDGFFFTHLPDSLNMKVIWFDNVPGSFQVHYVGKGEPKVAVSQACVGDKTWKHTNFRIDGLGSRLGERGSDFFIKSSDATDVIVHLIEAARTVTR